MPRRLLSAAAAGALLLGLAACGEGEEGTVTTPPPSINIDAPSDGGGDNEPSDGGGGGETGDPTAAAPDIPLPDPAEYAGMDEQTEDGAIQAFRYYIAVSMWAHQTGDDTELTRLQNKNCEGCPDFNSEISNLRELGAYWSEFAVTDIQLTPHESESFDYEIGYSFTIPKHTRPDPTTGGVEEYDPVKYIAIGGMSWEGDAWIVGGLTAEWGSGLHDKY